MLNRCAEPVEPEFETRDFFIDKICRTLSACHRWSLLIANRIGVFSWVCACGPVRENKP